LARESALITGAGGFIGANLARRLCAGAGDVHLFVRPQSDLWRLADLNEAETHHVDLTDGDAVHALVKRIRPTYVFHAAAHGAYSFQSDVHRMVAVNVHGTMNLLKSCLESGFDGFVHTGSSSEYGFKDHAPHEDEHVEPNSDYAVTKAAATLYCRYVAQSRALNVTTMRVYSAYGPYEEPRRLIPTLVVKGLDGELPDLVSPKTARDYIHVDDVVDACIVAAASGNGLVYNLGTGVQTTLADAVATARKVMSVEAEPSWGSMPGRSWDTTSWVSNPRRLASELGWEARLDFESGLRRTVDWLRDTPGMLDLYRARQSAA
jgi:nucleoside-diphosphate-sugar epimerase